MRKYLNIKRIWVVSCVLVSSCAANHEPQKGKESAHFSNQQQVINECKKSMRLNANNQLNQSNTYNEDDSLLNPVEVQQQRVDALEKRAAELKSQVEDKEPKRVISQNNHERFAELNNQIEMLEQEIKAREKQYRYRPRRRFIGATSDNPEEAKYIRSTYNKIESYGNQHYPEVAKQYALYGKVQLTLSIMDDGKLEKVVIERSSGCEILDSHAMEIVKAVAPYEPFTENMRSQFDILSLTRTFRYEKDPE